MSSPMTRSDLVEAMARGMAGVAYGAIVFTTRSLEQYTTAEWPKHKGLMQG